MSDSTDIAEAYARGRTNFMGVELLVAPGALVPRPETELLGRTAVEILRSMAVSAPRVIDMCCGAGNLACAIALQVPEARVWASDLTEGCVDVACRNVAHLALLDRVSVHRGDLFEPFDGAALSGTVDVIVCNPPYISDKRLETDRAHLLEHEPREAFAAGPYGLSIHMRVVNHAPHFLRRGGILLFEVGLGQDRQVTILFGRNKAYENVRVVKNAAGEGRVVVAELKASA